LIYLIVVVFVPWGAHRLYKFLLNHVRQQAKGEIDLQSNIKKKDLNETSFSFLHANTYTYRNKERMTLAEAFKLDAEKARLAEIAEQARLAEIEEKARIEALKEKERLAAEAKVMAAKMKE